MVGHIDNFNCSLQNHSGLHLLITVEETLIPLETHSQGSAPVIPSEPEGKEKGKRNSESLVTAKKWTQIATQRSRKPQNSESVQGKPTLTAFTGKITVINPVVTSEGKLPKYVDKTIVQGTVKGKYTKKTKLSTACKHLYVTCALQDPWNPRKPARGHLGHSGAWQDTEGNHTHSAIHLLIQQKP
ncbi:hypothetical protein O181_067209 [Austropuccinia psidii MF-1]|uniref:Uncharacterized protein n=1 Tax=Austropuccinia psidii MF-1 TaxID=1389203 RepID=A0A9Q3EUY4_9BASI|nr:hypothetical protein [Austropuccinia psidii MF-1]